MCMSVIRFVLLFLLCIIKGLMTVYIRATHPFSYHQGIMCKLLGIDCIVIDPNKTIAQQAWATSHPEESAMLETFYTQALPPIVHENANHSIQILNAFDFFKRNLVVLTTDAALNVPSSSGVFVMEDVPYSTLIDAERSVIELMAHYNLFPGAQECVDTPHLAPRILLVEAYANITGGLRGMTRDMALCFLALHRSTQSFVACLMCFHYLPGSRQDRVLPMLADPPNTAVLVVTDGPKSTRMLTRAISMQANTWCAVADVYVCVHAEDAHEATGSLSASQLSPRFILLDVLPPEAVTTADPHTCLTQTAQRAMIAASAHSIYDAIVVVNACFVPESVDWDAVATNSCRDALWFSAMHHRGKSGGCSLCDQETGAPHKQHVGSHEPVNAGANSIWFYGRAPLIEAYIYAGLELNPFWHATTHLKTSGAIKGKYVSV